MGKSVPQKCARAIAIVVEAEIVSCISKRPGHDFRYAMDPSGAERELGWRAKHDFESGLAQTIAWYLDNEAWWRPIRDKRYAGQRLGGVKA